MSALIGSVEAGVFAVLRETRQFDRVGIEQGAVSWPNAVDLAPDALHAAIKATGRCLLR